MSKQKNKKSITICLNKENKNVKDIIDFISIKNEIINIIDVKDFLKSIMNYNKGYSLEEVPDILIFDKSSYDHSPSIDLCYHISKKKYLFNNLKIISFGEFSSVLSKFNEAAILKDITNHKNTKHLCSFVLGENYILDYDVQSDHQTLIVPSKNQPYNVLAFSSSNISDSYTNENNETFKKKNNFIEIEAIKFDSSNNYCFFYEVPKKEELVLSDITLELIEL